jgi:predicted transcriptional regulator
LQIILRKIKMNNIHDRIELIIRELGITKNAFGDTCGISSGQMTNITKNKKDFGVSNLLKIISKYPINPIWLLTGEGQMFTNKDAKHLVNGTNKGVNGNINGGEISIQNIEHNTLVEEVTFLRGQITEKDKQISFFQSMLEKFSPQKP